MMKEMITKVTEKILQALGTVIGWLITKPFFKALEWLAFAKDFIRASVIVYKRHAKVGKLFTNGQDTYIKSVIVNRKTFQVHKNDHLRELGVCGACSIIGLFTGRYVYVDDTYLTKFSPELQQFILFHEIGHIMNKDFWRFGWKMLLNEVLEEMNNGIEIKDMVAANRLLESELGADMFAEAAIGTETALKAIKDLYRLLPADELKTRYKNLGGNPNDLINPIKWIIRSIDITNTMTLDEFNEKFKEV